MRVKCIKIKPYDKDITLDNEYEVVKVEHNFFYYILDDMNDNNLLTLEQIEELN
jgi:hypothetical protein